MKKIRSEKHRRFIASLPCCVTGKRDTQAAHIRHGTNALGLKPCDSRCVPLNWMEHMNQHSMSEVDYWEIFGIENAILLSQELYKNTGKTKECEEIILRFRAHLPFCNNL